MIFVIVVIVTIPLPMHCVAIAPHPHLRYRPIPSSLLWQSLSTIYVHVVFIPFFSSLRIVPILGILSHLRSIFFCLSFCHHHPVPFISVVCLPWHFPSCCLVRIVTSLTVLCVSITTKHIFCRLLFIGCIICIFLLIIFIVTLRSRCGHYIFFL